MGRRLSRPPSDPNKPRSLRELASILKVPYERVRRLRNDGLQLRTDGTFDLAEASSMMKQRGDRAPGGDPSTNVALTLRERLLEAKLQKVQLEIATALNRVVGKKEVLNQWRRSAVVVKNRLMALGSEVAPLAANKGPNEVKAIIDERVFQILHILAETKLTNAP